MADATRPSMSIRCRIAIFTELTVGLAAIVCVIVIPLFTRRIVHEHHQNVIREFNGWADEHSVVSDSDAAVRAAGMIGYISTYYSRSGGNRSDSETEQLLEDTRQRSMKRIADALSAYTGIVMANPLDWPAELCDNTRQISDGG